MFNFLRKPPNCFPQQLHQFTFHQQCTSILISPHPCQYLLFSLFKNNLHSYSTKCIVFSYCAYLYFLNDQSNWTFFFFLCVLIICISSLNQMSVPIHSTTWMNIENMLSGRCQTQNVTHAGFLLCGISRIGKSIKQKKDWWMAGDGWRNGEWLLKGYGVFFWDGEIFWN